jgi:hypothetical protein
VSLATWLLIALVVWLPLQTPLTIVLHQFANLPVDATRAIVLTKDVGVAIALVVLIIRHWRAYRWHWLALAAVLFTLVLGVYAVVPLFGSDPPSLGATIAGVRQFALPLELYGLGRLALLSGANAGRTLRAVVGVAVAAALFTLGVYALTPSTFWSSTLDLVRYVREVQGLPYANSLWDISVVGTYGPGAEPILRATGPFTHPVGTAAYFVLPLAMAYAAFSRAIGRGWRRWIVPAGASVLFGASILVTLSRGSWIAAAIVILVCGFALRRVRLAAAVLAVVALVVWFVPPFSVSVHGALGGTDGSAILHGQAVQAGVTSIGDHPLGLGVARSDYQFGATLGGDREGSLLENTYLSLFVGVGPLGLAAALAWVAGMALVLWPHRRSVRTHWLGLAMVGAMIGLGAASLTSATMLRFTTGATFWLVLGLLVGQMPARTLHVPWRRKVPAA